MQYFVARKGNYIVKFHLKFVNSFPQWIKRDDVSIWAGDGLANFDLKWFQYRIVLAFATIPLNAIIFDEKSTFSSLFFVLEKK